MTFHSYTLLFLFLLLLFPFNIRCQNMTLGTILSPSTNPSSLLSPSRDFAFGFRALDTNSTLFLLAVYYNKIKGKTVIWTANGGNPVSNISMAQLTSEGQLILRDSSNVQIWSANNGGASSGSMRDDGNFILYSGSSEAWRTFDSPTDTILPGQILKQQTTVFARLMDDDYSKGKFKLVMQGDGNLVTYAVDSLTRNQHDPYYATGTQDNPGKNRLLFNTTGSLYVLFNNGTIVPVLPETALIEVNYLRATLDPDGGFRKYIFPKTQPSNGSSLFWSGSGICGFNSYCTNNESGLANCLCPPHYTFIDPIRKYKGCKPDYIPQLCEQGSGSSFSFQTIENLDWPLSDAETLSPMNDIQCQAECLNDCFCVVAIYNNDGTCWKKKSPLSNGKLNQNVNRVAYIKYNKLNISSNASGGGSGNRNSWVIIISSNLVCSVVWIILQIGACFYMHIKRNREMNSSKASSIVSVSATCSFTYNELEQATKGFSEELGKGAFGVVYKGVLPSQSNDNTIVVAVKKLEESLLEESEQDFENEVATIGRTHHKNLVQLLGYCKEGSHRLIVFEFLSKGSLNKYIFGSNRPTWDQRVQIILAMLNRLYKMKHDICDLCGVNYSPLSTRMYYMYEDIRFLNVLCFLIFNSV